MVGGRCDDFIDVWEFIKDERSYYFSDIDNIENKIMFNKLYDEKIFDVCVARDENKNICLASYVFINGYKSLLFSGLNAKEYRSPKYSVPCAKLAIKYFFDRYGINRLDVMGRNDNRLSRLVSARLGFKKVGVINKLLPHLGIVKDYYYSSILREEV